MGSLFKKTITSPLPPVAEIITRQGERRARWHDGKGKMRTAPVTTGQNGTDRIRDESGTYVDRYRDGNALVVEVSTGCRDKTAAQSDPESGRPPWGFWDGSASAHHMRARITASSWDTFDQATAGPSEPLLS